MAHPLLGVGPGQLAGDLSEVRAGERSVAFRDDRHGGEPVAEQRLGRGAVGARQRRRSSRSPRSSCCCWAARSRRRYDLQRDARRAARRARRRRRGAHRRARGWLRRGAASAGADHRRIGRRPVRLIAAGKERRAVVPSPDAGDSILGGAFVAFTVMAVRDRANVGSRRCGCTRLERRRRSSRRSRRTPARIASRCERPNTSSRAASARRRERTPFVRATCSRIHPDRGTFSRSAGAEVPPAIDPRSSGSNQRNPWCRGRTSPIRQASPSRAAAPRHLPRFPARRAVIRRRGRRSR